MAKLPLSDGSGLIYRFANFDSNFVSARHVDVWLPPGYAEATGERYPVIYMHDGQNLFDPACAYGGVDWGMDEALAKLSREEGLPPAIVVGVWNSPIRWREYMPQKPLGVPQAEALRQQFSEQQGGEPVSDRYLRFLVDELKAFIDASYRTRPGRASTFVMGSSMGGLVSLYALCEYPEVFGGAGCISTHWPAGGEVLVDALGAALPSPGAHRLYFDYGTETLDASYEPFQGRMDTHLRAAGYREGGDWMTRKFPGAEHCEKSWRERVHIPLRFLLGGNEQKSNT